MDGVAARTDAEGRPVSGRWFEELEAGTVVTHVTRRTVTETDNVLFTTMTMNPAPLHLDADYAAHTEFGKPLVNSMFTLALVVGLSVPELTLGTIVAQLGIDEARFPTPVFGRHDPGGHRGRRGPRVAVAARAGPRRVRAPRLQPA
jgi:acyl dehydratase